MKETLKSATFEPVKEFKLPPGATVISKETRVSVEQIKNGFLLKKSYDIKWRAKDDDSNNYDYYSETWFSTENPMTYQEPANLTLADKLK